MEKAASYPSMVATMGLVTVLAVGTALRLTLLDDMEYKRDERWTFEQTEIGSVSPTQLGMPSSVELVNPGLSIWAFVALARLGGAHEPVRLARMVALGNVLAIAVLAAFAWRGPPAGEREAWLWTVALWSVNPLAVLFHRKIWPPSLLAPLAVVMLLAWWWRERAASAFLWGLVGALIGQIHVSGFFYACGIAAWTFAFDRSSVGWKSFAAGSLLGVIPAIPWLAYLWQHFGSAAVALHLQRWLELNFWLRFVTEPFGFGLGYSLGADFGDFLAYPSVLGHPTYLVAVLHGVLGALALSLAARAIGRLVLGDGDAWIGRETQTAFVRSAVVWGSGLALTASALAIHRHYMVVFHPIECLTVASVAIAVYCSDELARCRRLLLMLVVTQALLSASFIAYLHEHGGAPHGDYGVSYAAQGVSEHGR